MTVSVSLHLPVPLSPPHPQGPYIPWGKHHCLLSLGLQNASRGRGWRTLNLSARSSKPHSEEQVGKGTFQLTENYFTRPVQRRQKPLAWCNLLCTAPVLSQVHIDQGQKNYPSALTLKCKFPNKLQHHVYLA